MKFDDFYVREIAPLNKTKFIMENDIPIQSRPFNITKIYYENLFDPPEIVRLLEVLFSPST